MFAAIWTSSTTTTTTTTQLSTENGNDDLGKSDYLNTMTSSNSEDQQQQQQQTITAIPASSGTINRRLPPLLLSPTLYPQHQHTMFGTARSSLEWRESRDEQEMIHHIEKLEAEALSNSDTNSEKKRMEEMRMAYQQLGECYEAKEMFDKALQMYTRSLAIAESESSLKTSSSRKEEKTPSSSPSNDDSDNNNKDAVGGGGGGPEESSEKGFVVVIPKRHLNHQQHQLLIGALLGSCASMHEALEQYDQAIPLFKRAISVYESVVSRNNPDLAMLLNSLGSCYQALGDRSQALSLHQDAIAIAERTVGADHPDVGMMLTSLAGLYEAEGNFAEAIPLYERDLAIQEKELGEHHPELASLLVRLGRLYKRTDMDKSIALYSRALGVNERALGPDHPKLLGSLKKLGKLLEREKRFGEAEAMYLRALSLRDLSSKSMFPVLMSVAKIKERNGAIKDAIDYFERALLMRERQEEDMLMRRGSRSGLPAGETRSVNAIVSDSSSNNKVVVPDGDNNVNHSPTTATTANSSSPSTTTTTNAPILDMMLSKSIANQSPCFLSDRASLDLIHHIAMLKEHNGELIEAAALLTKYVSLKERILGTFHPDLLPPLYKIAQLYESLDLEEKSIPPCSWALAILEKEMGDEDESLLPLISHLAQIHQRLKQYGSAQPLLERALAIRLGVMCKDSAVGADGN